MTLKWNGKALLKDVLRAAVPAMNDTTRAVVQNAQGKVRRRTGNLADSIDKDDAVIEGDEVTGRVGVNDKHGVIYGGDRGNPQAVPTPGAGCRGAATVEADTGQAQVIEKVIAIQHRDSSRSLLASYDEEVGQRIYRLAKRLTSG